MTDSEIQEQVVKILGRYARDAKALAAVTGDTHILEGLDVDSAQLVDAVLEFEDVFDIEISDEELDDVGTVRDCVAMIAKRKA